MHNKKTSIFFHPDYTVGFRFPLNQPLQRSGSQA
ncbi:unnamed protein product [Staphylococcus haemolyticus JCSC1435]|uniref:Uncharacterized protein n=1 Tax=Staphylococcus haemolyticus (strain JCSC1435) TaxID=279808 RepID=Q4L6J0_STAHJ|nr:unnamed protein product [Staphylococcus haemolyticus JCSC1435]